MVMRFYKVKDIKAHRLLVLFFAFFAAGIIAAGFLYYQRQAQWWAAIIVGVIFFGAGVSVGVIWGRQRIGFYKERSKTAAALRESEARFRTLFEQATDGMLLVDLEIRHFILTNQQMQKMLGYSEDQLLRLTVPDDLHPADDLPRVRDLFEKMARGKITTASDVPVKRKDGTVFFTDISATPIRLQQHDCLLGIFRDITERKRVDEALRESEERYRTLFEQAAVGVALVETKTGRYIRINQKYCDFLGYTVEEMLHKTFKDITYHDDAQPNIDNNALLAVGKIREFSIEKRYVRKDGAVVWGNLTVSPLWKPGTEPDTYFHIAVVEDITERKRAEVALRESEGKYRALVETTDTGFLILDGQGKILDANQEYVRLSGHSELREILGRHVAEWTAEHEKRRNVEAITQCRRDGQIKNLVIDYVDGRGRITPVEINATVNGRGESLRIISLCRDITERKRAEAALRQNEAQIHTIIESTADGILAVDSKGKVIKANQRFADLWRIPKSLTEGGDDKALLDFVLDQLSNPAAFLKKVQALYKTDAIDMDTLAFKDGRVFERYSTPMIKGGSIVGRVWSFRDVTERKQLQQKLLQSQKMEAIGQLTAGIAHEFNNLLASILGYVSLALARLPSDSPLRHDLEQMETASKRAVTLTRQLLMFGRKHPQELKPVNLNAVVLDMKQMLQTLLGETIHLTTSLDPALGIVIADPAQMGQVIMNMSVNARDAMPLGGELTIATVNVQLGKNQVHWHADATPGSYIRLTVSDTGVGMGDDVMAKIFDPFFTTKEVGHGSGLGLPICVGIIKQTGGFIEVDSAPGRGATFQIFLPRANAAAMAAIAAGATQPPNQ